MVVMFAVLIFFGGKVYQEAPPIPLQVQSSSGETLFTFEEIQYGQNVWQSLGGMQRGSIWVTAAT